MKIAKILRGGIAAMCLFAFLVASVGCTNEPAKPKGNTKPKPSSNTT